MTDLLASLPSLRENALIYGVVAALVIIPLIARRIPVVGTLVRVASWVVLIGLAVALISQRERFDPYFAELVSSFSRDKQEVVGKEVRIRMAPDGHFWANATIDGVERRMLIDSGATVTAIATDTAAAARVEAKDPMFPLILRTANGMIRAQTGTVDELKLGNIVARDLAVVVSPAFGENNVLGMNFLSRLKSWRVEERTLILVPHHPQPVTG